MPAFPPAPEVSSIFHQSPDEILKESGGGEGIPTVDLIEGNLRQVVRLTAGLHRRPHQGLGKSSRVERRSGPRTVQADSSHGTVGRLCRITQPESRRGTDQVHRRRHVREGDPGHVAYRCSQVGARRDGQGLWSLILSTMTTPAWTRYVE